MKRFALFVVLATLACFLLHTREAQGQLAFNPRGPRKNGRSLDNVSIESILS